jgi:hypothetical protein
MAEYDDLFHVFKTAQCTLMWLAILRHRLPLEPAALSEILHLDLESVRENLRALARLNLLEGQAGGYRLVPGAGLPPACVPSGWSQAPAGQKKGESHSESRPGDLKP